MWGLITEQILLGQLNPTKYIDFSGKELKPKISSIFIDKSSTGKDQAGDALIYAAKKFGLKIDKVVDIQEAGLTGTIKGRSDIRYGKLKDHNIIVFPECSNLFVRTEHKTTLITSLQSAIEKVGFVNKTVGGRDIKYETDVSLLLMSIPFERVSEVIVDKGIFQRCIISYMNRNFSSIKSIYSKAIVSDGVDDREFREYKNKIDEAIRCAPSTVMIGKDIIDEMNKTVLPFFEDKRLEVEDDFKRGVFDGYLIRSAMNVLKMAVNEMFKMKKQKIDMECFEIPLKIYKHHIQSVCDMFNGITISEEYHPGTKNTKPYSKERVYGVIRKHNGNMTELYKKIAESENCGMNKAQKIYKKIMYDESLKMSQKYSKQTTGNIKTI